MTSIPSPNEDERNWAMAAHLTALLGALAGGIPGFLGPLVILLVKGGESRFVREHAAAALNFQLSLLIYGLISVVLAVLTLGLGLLVLLPVWAIIAIVGAVFLIQGMLAARDGRPYDYPLTLPLVS